MWLTGRRNAHGERKPPRLVKVNNTTVVVPIKLQCHKASKRFEVKRSFHQPPLNGTLHYVIFVVILHFKFTFPEELNEPKKKKKIPHNFHLS